MLNRSGVAKSTYAATKQILANVEFQVSVGCIVPQSLGVTVGNNKIAKAGTPIKIDLLNTQTPVVKADGTNALNAVLLHDVDVTAGNANGTALIFGFVNVNRVEADVAAAITTAATATGASPKITFVKL
jgi:hypothetical protein